MNCQRFHLTICTSLLALAPWGLSAQGNDDSSPSLQGVVERYLTNEGLKFRYVDENRLFRLNLTFPDSILRCAIVVLEERRRVMVLTSLPVAAPLAKRAQAAEYLTRANFGLVVGNFELDYADGEVRFKTSVDVTGGELSPEMVRRLLLTNISVVRRYLPGLLKVLQGAATPSAAIDEVEGAVPSHRRERLPSPRHSNNRLVV